MRDRTALLLGVLVLLGPACGHKGDPLPPLRRTPPPPEGFRLAQRGDALEVRATAPAASLDGVAFEALTVEFLYADGTKDLEKSGERRAVPAAPGARVAATLPLPAPGTSVRAAARGVAGRDRGQRTLTLAIVAQAPLEAPHELNAVLAETGVRLSWRGVRPKAATPPTLGPARPPAVPAPLPAPGAGQPADAKEDSPPSGGPPIAGAQGGFFVYRRAGAVGYDEPLGDKPLDRRSFEDVAPPPDSTVCYVVRAVASTDPLVESAPSNEACVAVRDIAAPAPPAGLAVLPRDAGLEVLWSPSPETDLAGYRVYRTAPGGQAERVAEVPTNQASWLDGSAQRGVEYRYTVTAFDAAGNESAPGEAVEASLP
jgi:hypothetical protein